MKILFLSEKFPPANIGGAEMVTFRLAQELQKMGHDLKVVMITNDPRKAGSLVQDNIKVFRLYSDYPKFLRNYLSLHNFFITKKLKEILTKVKPEIVHAHLINFQISFYVLKLAKKTGAKVFLTAHDVTLFNDGKLVRLEKFDKFPTKLKYHVTGLDLLKTAKWRFNPWRNFGIRKYLKCADKIFSVSEELKKALAVNGITNVETIYNGVNLADFQISDDKVVKFVKRFNLEDKKVIFFGGRISKSKGAELLVPIMKEVVAKVPNVLLLVAGTENNATKLLKQGLPTENIKCTGWLTGDELKAAYRASAICVTPSICFDTFNLTNIEAMALGVPVVGTIFGGTPEIVQDGQTGFIANPFDTNYFAEKIIELLTDENKRKQFGQAGYQRVKEKFSIKKQAEAVLAWYQK